LIGVDLVLINRIESVSRKHGDKFLDKFLSKQEQIIANSIKTVAGFWAVKEAVSKAIGCGICGDFGFFDVEIKKNNKGAPSIDISSRVKDKFSISKSSVSITHDGNFAIAVVLLQ
jgi:holo-[acyl-carrier protein] synthase